MVTNHGENHMNFFKRANTNQTTRFIDFAINDAKGRPVGCAVITRTYALVPQDADKTWGYHGPAGDRIDIEVQATRNGKLYGASQHGKTFNKGEDAAVLAYTNKRIVASKMAAQKKFA
jgi:hypothetical protein